MPTPTRIKSTAKKLEAAAQHLSFEIDDEKTKELAQVVRDLAKLARDLAKILDERAN